MKAQGERKPESVQEFKTAFRQVDVLPMVKFYMNSLDLFNLFQKHLPHQSEAYREYANCLCLLTANIICENQPLYKVEEWLSRYSDGIMDVPACTHGYNDDRFARSLSALFKTDRDSLLTELSGKAIAVHGLMTDEIHNDSTSITFIGKYDNPSEETVKLTHGHNKDFRPDCKQIVFGLNITADGHVPLGYRLYDGNTPDDVTHIPNWNSLRKLLGKEDFVYVADCKLCSEENLDHIADNGGSFITIVPKGRKEVKAFMEHLQKNEVEWDDAFTLDKTGKKKRTTHYRTHEFNRTKKGYRMIWVHSSSKEEDEREKREAKIQKALTDLKGLAPKLNQYHLKTQKDIRNAVNKILKGVEGLISIKMETDRKQKKVKRIPLPESRKDKYENRWVFTHRIEWKRNEREIELASRNDGVFPLVTNTRLEPSEVLAKYKNQAFLEKRMYTKKTVLGIAPVFLKKEERIEALVFLYFVALMIVSLIERKIRMNMEAQKVEKLPILPQGMNTAKPTWNNIRYFFRDAHLATIEQNSICIHSSVNAIGEQHKKILELLEVPITVYMNLNDRWWSFKGS